MQVQLPEHNTPHNMRRNSTYALSLFCLESCKGNLWPNGTGRTLNLCRQGPSGYYVKHCVVHDVNSKNKPVLYDLRTNSSAHVELKALG